jgi:hypothetical protein
MKVLPVPGDEGIREGRRPLVDDENISRLNDNVEEHIG